MGTRPHGAISGESNTDDVKVLGTGILHVLKDIGTSDAERLLPVRSMVTLEQIMEHVAFCIDGFLWAKEYHSSQGEGAEIHPVLGWEQPNKVSTKCICKIFLSDDCKPI